MGVSEVASRQGLRRDVPTPLYAQLEEILRGRIENNEWKPGDRIPSENELNKMFGVSRMTARGVLNTLTNEGLLFRVPGKGTFVAEPKIETVSPAYRGVREQLESMGIETTTRLISMQRERPPAKIAQHLQLSTEDEVYAIVRVRSVHGHPISLHNSWVPARLAHGLDTHDPVNEQLCVILSDCYGLRMSRVEEQLETTTLSGTESDLLEMPAGQPVLLLQDRIYDAHGVPFEYSKIVFRGDRVRLRFTYDV